MTHFHIPKKRAKQKMGVRQSDIIRCAPHLRFLRSLECAVKGRSVGLTGIEHLCGGRIEAAHVRIGTDGGTGMKPGDNWAIPLCADAHAQQHRIGELSFSAAYRIDMKATAAELWKRSPHRIAYERKKQKE